MAFLINAIKKQNDHKPQSFNESLNCVCLAL